MNDRARPGLFFHISNLPASLARGESEIRPAFGSISPIMSLERGIASLRAPYRWRCFSRVELPN
jgi:hypothetical protein